MKKGKVDKLKEKYKRNQEAMRLRKEKN